MTGKYVKAFAAMRSMHFGYAFPSAAFTAFMRTDTLEKGDFKRGMFWQACYEILGLGYPALILLTLLLGRYGGCELCGSELWL